MQNNFKKETVKTNTDFFQSLSLFNQTARFHDLVTTLCSIFSINNIFALFGYNVGLIQKWMPNNPILKSDENKNIFCFVWQVPDLQFHFPYRLPGSARGWPRFGSRIVERVKRNICRPEKEVDMEVLRRQQLHQVSLLPSVPSIATFNPFCTDKTICLGLFSIKAPF